jgi:hypothetical protein
MTTTTVATTTVATVARTMVARTMSIVPCSTTTTIHEDALSVETIKVEIERRLGAMVKEKKSKLPIARTRQMTRKTRQGPILHLHRLLLFLVIC